ncbi:hypothetical protein BC834DRAFT_589847 [Gloeopeniophorella convolvens]|nr:hypothetical protein BC834DRAFT_589847 [Gloeopeniophorella convolvens]
MELYLIPNDPVNTVLISADGVPHFQVRTSRRLSSLRTSSSVILRLAPGLEESEQETLGEIVWGGLGRNSVVHSELFKRHATLSSDKAVRVKDLLWKINTFGTSRCFIGNDEEEYLWKFSKGTGFQLFHVRTGCVKALYEPNPSHVAKGAFEGQFKTCLRIHPSCMLDLDILVLTFIIMEKKRRDSLGDQVNVSGEEESVAEASGLEGGGGMM